MVECGSIKFIPVAVRYRAFHASAVVKGSQKSQNVEKKILHWKSEDAGQERLPPNVLIFGLDSTSRLNFRRNMFETRRFLENIGAVEMLGYTKGYFKSNKQQIKQAKSQPFFHTSFSFLSQ